MDVNAIRAALEVQGLRLRHFDNNGVRHDVLNIIGVDRELARGDVDAFRTLLAEQGLTEVKSWVAWEGVSWLSTGLMAGVSFEVYDPSR